MVDEIGVRVAKAWGERQGEKRHRIAWKRREEREVNNAPNYKKGNRLEIIKILYTNVALPYRSLRMYKGQTRLTHRLAKKMEKEGLLEIVSGEGGVKYIVVKGVKENYLDTYARYMDKSYLSACLKQMEEYTKCKAGNGEDRAYSEKKRLRLERLLNMSETILMMHLGNVNVYPDETISLESAMRSGELPGDKAIFYTSTEIKRAGYIEDVEKAKDGSKKVQTSRIYGMLVSDGGIYAVYNISNRLIEWKQYGEIKMQHHIKRITRGMNRASGEDIGCVLLANEMKMFARVITNEYDRNRKGYQILLNIDYAYENMYGLPTTKEGIEMLMLMQEKDWKEQLERNLLAGCTRNIKSYSVVCDAQNEEDGYILLFCNGNIARLKLFLQRAVNAREDEKFCVYCFDFQLPLLAALEIGDTAVKSMSIYEYKRMIGEREENANEGENDINESGD